MKTIKIISSKELDYTDTFERVRQMAEARSLEVKLEKGRIIPGIQGSGVMQTAGIFIEGARVHSGIPDAGEIEAWLDEIEEAPCCGFCGGQGREFFKSLKESPLRPS